MASRELQFIINVPHSGGSTASSESQRRVAHSHAARSAHAKARRLRTIQYQAQKRREEQDQLNDPNRGLKTLRDVLRPEVIRSLPADRRDPFMSFAMPLKPIEQMLFDHYVTAIIPLMRCNELTVDFSHRMTTSWVPLAFTEESLLNIIFLSSCRHLAMRYKQQQQQQFFTRLAFQYKLDILQSLRHAISLEAPLFSDSTVAKAIMLAYDEMFVWDEKMLKHHVEGAVKMVALNGGPQTLGLDGFLEHLLSNLLTKVVGQVGLQVRIPWDNRASEGFET